MSEQLISDSVKSLEFDEDLIAAKMGKGTNYLLSRIADIEKQVEDLKKKVHSIEYPYG